LTSVPDDLLPWSQAWESAGFGTAGFYRRATGRPRDHFRTAVQADDRVARRVAALALPELARLARTHPAADITVTDAGADEGRLVAQLRRLVPERLRDRLSWRALDLAPRPVGLDPCVDWVQADARSHGLAPGPGLVVAHELLDDIPLDVLEVDADGVVRLVLVDAVSGHQELGPALDDRRGCRDVDVDADAVRSWVSQWWRRVEPFARIEAGLSRDRAWQSAAGLVSDGLVVAVDYSHVLAERETGRWDGGTLVGYRAGRAVSPVPDGSCNLTAHVALDSCAAAVAARSTTLTGPDGPDAFRWLVQRVGA
jgi:SAM-dependent MidA family methyltransferase